MKKALLRIIAACAAAFLTTAAVAPGRSVSAQEGAGEQAGLHINRLTNPYPGGWGNCTWSAWTLVYQADGIALPSFGNAGNWAQSAVNAGFYVSSIPAANTVIVWSNHVAFVTAVSEDGNSVYIKEGGYNGGYNEAWVPAYGTRYGQTLYGYIYLSGEVPASYYKPGELVTTTLSPKASQQQAEQAKQIAEEQEKVTIIEDAAAQEEESLKSDEKQGKEDIKKEDKAAVTISPVDPDSQE